MHKSKRLLFLFVFLLGLLIINCHRSTPNSLRILKINKGLPLIADTEDEWTTGSGEEMESHAETPNYSVELEVAYTEMGTGLPTYFSYRAKITSYTVTFTDITPGSTPGEFSPAPVKGTCNLIITADPEGKDVVKQSLLILPAAWIDEYSELEDGKILNAKITLRGKDEISGLDVTGDGNFTINIKNFRDDPNKRGE